MKLKTDNIRTVNETPSG